MDEDLELVLLCCIPPNPVLQHVPAYEFEMRSVEGGVPMGELRFRVGDAENALRYPGHIGFEVKDEFRGRRYAARSLLLLLPFARAHGLTGVWLSCDPDNLASRRTCEIAGARLREIVEIPRTHDMYLKGMHVACRYLIDLGGTGS